MIELIEGVPGSGKSYYTVAERLLVWLRANRRIYLYIDGIYLDRLAHFEGRPLPELEEQITVWRSSEEVMTNLTKVDPRSVVIIDEAQTVFRSMQKVEPSLLRWLETHRHYGVDVVMMCQSWLQLTAGVTRLVESTTKFRKLSFFGLYSWTQGIVRGNPEETEVIRKFVLKFQGNVYAYYSSYAQAAITEEQRMPSIWKSPKMIIGGVAAGFALMIMVVRPWSSLGDPKPPTGVPVAAKSVAAAPPGGPGPGASPALAPPGPRMTAKPIVIVGTAVWEGEREAHYLLADGTIVTAAQLAGRYGLAVQERWDGQAPFLVGEGITYGSSRE
jgi:zona occludens toxin (predicted ATPase)